MHSNLKPFSILFLLILSGCNFKKPDSITTKSKTIEAIIGKWRHADLKKSDVKDIVFTRHTDKTGGYTCILTFTKKDNNGNLSQSKSWRYVDIGKIELFDVDCPLCTLPISMINNHTFDLNYHDIYNKDE